MKDHMEYVIKNFRNGYFDQLMGDTAKGAQIEQDFLITNSAINDSGRFNKDNPEDVASQRIANVKNLNSYMSKKVSLGTSIHLPNEWINPISYQYLAPIKESFIAGKDPNNALEGMFVLDPEMKSYLVNAMPNVQQRETMRIVAQASKETPKEFLQEVILANQTRADFSTLKIKDIKETKLRTLVQSELSDILDFNYRNGNATTMLGQSVGTPNGEQIIQGGQQRQAGLVDAAINYVKYKAIQKNDFEMDHVDSYISQFKNNIGTTYDIISGYDYSINNRNLGISLSKSEADLLANHAIMLAMQRIKGNASESEFMSMLDRNPLFMTIDQYNNIVVTDVKSKSVIYHMPFTKSFLDAAIHHKKMDFENRPKYPETLVGFRHEV